MPTVRMGHGHSFAQVSGAFIDAWGDGPLLIRDNGRQWHFEFSEMFGPVWLKREGRHFEPSIRQPMREDDPFWRPFTRWNNSGRKCRPITTKRGRFICYLCHVPPEGLD
jgi:hypothetical protein